MLPTQVAARYSPISGLITDNNYGASTGDTSGRPAAGFSPGGGSGGGDAPIYGGPGDITIGGSPGTPPVIPDYSALLASDPGLLAAEADLSSSSVANAAQRNAAFQRDVVDYGASPDMAATARALGLGSTDLTGILGPDISKLADENTAAGTSELAQLNAANTKTIQGIRNALGARGIYNSGETGYQLGLQGQAYQNSQYDALTKMLDAMQSSQGQYVSAEQALEETLANAEIAADANVRNEYPPIPGTPPTPSTTATYAGLDINHDPVYVDPSGNYYDQTGSPYTGPRSQNFGFGDTGIAIGAFK